MPVIDVIRRIEETAFLFDNDTPTFASLPLLSTPIGAPGMIHVGHYLLQSPIDKGEVVEFGVWRGFTAGYMGTLVKKRLWLYDSFQGLPKPNAIDCSEYPEGQFKNTNVKAVESLFHWLRCPPPIIFKKWFSELTQEDMPKSIAFAHLDGDLYDSVTQSLKLVYPNLCEGAWVLIHDYHSDKFQGAKKAVDDFMADKIEPLVILNGIGGPACHVAFQKGSKCQ